MEINQAKIELFKKITEMYLATDYSSADWLYLPARMDASFSKIIFSGEDAYSKIFYSPEVLRKCQQILDFKSSQS